MPQLTVHTMGTTVSADLSHSWLTDDDRHRIRRSWARTNARLALRSAPPDNDPVREQATTSVPGWLPPTAWDATPVSVPAQRLRGHTDLARLANAIATEVTLAAIERQAGHLLMLHAGGVADPATGHTIAFVAPSGTGKTTATRTLAQSWGYVSDETIAVDPATRQIWPHPKPLSVRDPQDATVPKRQLAPDDLGLVAAPDQLRLARIVLLERDPGHTGPPRLVPLGLARAIGDLTRESSFLSRWTDPLDTIAALVNATGGVLRLRYAEAADLPPVLPQIIETSRHHQAWQPVSDEALPATGWPTGPCSAAPKGARHAAGTDPVIKPKRAELSSSFGHSLVPRPTPVREAIADDTTVILLLQGRPERVVVLDGIGPTLWRLACSARTLTVAELATDLVARFGAPPSGSAEELVGQGLRSLQQHGVLHDLDDSEFR